MLPYPGWSFLGLFGTTLAAYGTVVFSMSFRATDLGVGVWTANSLGKREVVSLGRLSGHFILAPIIIQRRALWITVAFDHVRKNV